MRKLKQNMTEQKDMAVKALFVQYFLIVSFVVQIAVVLLSRKSALFPGSEMIVNIAGTCAEIVAGLYGITMAGYTFFLSRMDSLVMADMTLDYIVNSVKLRYKYIIWYITVNVLLTLLTSILLMYCPMPEGELLGYIYRLFCNEFVVFLTGSIILILYYSINVIDPKGLEKEAKRLKKKLSPAVEKQGDVMEFIHLYSQIEVLCNKLIPVEVLQQLHENKGKHFEYTIELLYETRPLIRPLLVEIRRIHRYYECVVNSTPMTASQEMCTSAKRVLIGLKEIIR